MERSVGGRAAIALVGLTAGLAVALPVRSVLTWGAPPAWWHYLAFGLGWLALLFPLARRAPRRAALAASAAFLLVLAGGFGAPWGPHDRFLEDLAGVQPGMTQGQVQNAMAGHIRGVASSSDPGDERYAVGVGAETYRVVPEGDYLDIGGCDAYRHSGSSADWGVVCFGSGRVESVRFLHD